jgi:hypothetical protein
MVYKFEGNAFSPKVLLATRNWRWPLLIQIGGWDTMIRCCREQNHHSGNDAISFKSCSRWCDNEGDCSGTGVAMVFFCWRCDGAAAAEAIMVWKYFDKVFYVSTWAIQCGMYYSSTRGISPLSVHVLGQMLGTKWFLKKCKTKQKKANVGIFSHCFCFFQK